MNIIIKALIILTFLSSACQLYAVDVNEKVFFKVTYSDQSLADKITISLHHAMLEINRSEKYIITELSDDEMNLLQKYDVNIEPAIAWGNQFKRMISRQKSQVSHQYTSIPGYECYPTVEETYLEGEHLAGHFPTLATWLDIGDSWMKVNSGVGYDLMVLKITNTTLTHTKPILFIHSSMHAREYAPAALNLDFAKWLLNDYEKDANAKWIVDNREVHLLFHMNPDGRKVAEKQILQRKNLNQHHCADSRREDDVGVDLNRNFAFSWHSTELGSSGDECHATYRGISPESEPETQAVSDYIRSLFSDERGEFDRDAAPIEKSGLHIDLHSYGELILWPFGHTSQVSANHDSFAQLGTKLSTFNQYTPKQSIGLYATDGTSDSVSYGELGVAALTFELGNSFFQNCESYNEVIKPDNLRALQYAAKVSQAPYLLPFGADILSLTVNQSLNETTVAKGSSVVINVMADHYDVVDFEYVINGHFLENNNVNNEQSHVVHNVLSDISVNQENLAMTDFMIDTSGLNEGRHVLTVRAKNGQGYYGAPASAFITLSNVHAPKPEFTYSCVELVCTFDASASVDEDGEITSFQWHTVNNTVNDVLLGETDIMEYQFSTSGAWVIQLTLVDNDGLSATSTQTINVQKSEVIEIQSPHREKSSSGGTFFYLLVFLCFAIKDRWIIFTLNHVEHINKH